MKIVLAGGSGSLGRRVAEDFRHRGFEVVILTRSPRDDIGHRQVVWDGRTAGTWAAELEGSVVFNLAGELVDRRPTRQNIELLTRHGWSRPEHFYRQQPGSRYRHHCGCR